MSDFVRRLCLYFQSVDFGRHQVAERVVHEPMSLNLRLAGKCVRHDTDVKVPLAFLRTGVAGMQVALVLDQQVVGRKCCREAFSDALPAVGHQGSTYLNGLTTGQILEHIGEVGEFDRKPGTGIAVQIDVEDAVGVMHQSEELSEKVEEQL